MKKILSVVLLMIFTIFMSAQNTKEFNIKIYPQNKQQVIEGWGVSLCWWANMCGKWNEEKIDEIIDLMVSENNLNWNIFRYNIGGGDNPSHIDGNNGHMCKGKGKRAEMEGFKDAEDVEYNWRADSAQRAIMLKIKEKRPDAIFEAFSNSAPYWMTYSGCSSGNYNAKKDNLKPHYYDAFCDYLIDVCKHYKDTYDREFKTIEPFNEPVTNYWNYMGSQEGCYFDPSSQITLIRKLYSKLKDSGLKTEISASDETNIATSISVLQKYIEAKDIISMIGQWNVHTYAGSNKERMKLQNLISENNIRFWMSESGNGGKGINGNLKMAQRMINDLTYMKPSAWVDWQYVEEGNDQWCMLKGDFEKQNYEIMKNFYVRMHITRFIKQGYTIISTDHDNVLAALCPQNKELVIVALNNDKNNFRLNLDLSEFRITNNAKLYLTDNIHNCDNIGTEKVIDSKLIYTLQPKSIMTSIISIE